MAYAESLPVPLCIHEACRLPKSLAGPDCISAGYLLAACEPWFKERVAPILVVKTHLEIKNKTKIPSIKI